MTSVRHHQPAEPAAPRSTETGASTETAAGALGERPAAAPGGVGLVVLDVVASGLLASVGAVIVDALDRRFVVPLNVSLTTATLVCAAFSLLGPFGAGVERGRGGAVPAGVAHAISLGATLGALGGAVLFEGAQAPLWLFLLRALPPLVLGPPLCRFAVRFARPDEPWREAARRGPPEATPAFARRVARTRFPLVVRLVTEPLAVATLPVAAALVLLVRIYQITVSRLMPPECRFEPSCSRYGFEALRRHGLVRGLVLTAFRVGRCQPFCTGGHDPVPDAAPEAVSR